MASPDLSRHKSLRIASDSLLSELELLQKLEAEKRELPPADPRFVELAQQIEDLAVHVHAASARQRSKGQELHDSDSPLSEVPISEAPSRPINEILSEWRDAERRATEAGEGSLEAALATAEIERLRAEYKRAHELATRVADPRAS